LSARGAVRLALVWALAAVAATGAAADVARPHVACDAHGRCAVSHLPPIASDREVRRYLESGLTTSLVFTLSVRDRTGRRHEAGARVDVRYEPWEERFDLWVFAAGESPRKEVVAPDKLAGWWSELRMSFTGLSEAAGAARVDVDLIPFSEEEEADTRRWYAETLRGGGVPRSGTDGLAASTLPMLDALTLTSIKRHGVLRFSWSSPVDGSP
jgi:hypothetical protein